ncbi:hypothetical protein GAYE_FCTG49G0012 [Galdieria yellowstonensis]|uniref:rRNA-processing protein FYV7 n=1 Tax=Galdieria yellowstonensis TaxID=3028027 RepID=A0AAV9I5A5_9RHOD|nr:hypothetical protein GAYE_FCTG49G0012 [Galdieria yellowstonensis]
MSSSSSHDRHGIQVAKLLQRQGKQAKRFQSIVKTQQQKKDRDRRRVAEYKKWLAKLEKKGELERYSIKEWYGNDTTGDNEKSLNSRQYKEAKVASDVEQDGVQEMTAPDNVQSYNKQQPLETETFQQVIESQKKEKFARLQKRKEKHKKLSLRTRKGQPIMKYQMANVLEKLQRDKEKC